MLLTVTGDQLKQAARTANVTQVPARSCSICSATLFYLIQNGELFFDSSCGCTYYSAPPEPRDWGSAASWVNLQTDEAVQREILSRFGWIFEDAEPAPTLTSIHIVGRDEDHIEVDASAGAYIGKVCEEAKLLARYKDLPVRFMFNGHSITVTKDSDPEECVLRFQEEVDREQEEWQKSPEGIASEQRRLQNIKDTQIQIDALLAELPNVIENPNSLVAWVGAFARVNDVSDVNVHAEQIINQLEAVGYQANDEVGSSCEELMADKQRGARYIVGQALDHLHSGMPMHPILSEFATRYAAE